MQAERVDQVEYFHIELDTHDVILAEGAPAESFIDDDSRGMFHNAHEYRELYAAAAADGGAILRAATAGRLRGRRDPAAHCAARRPGVAEQTAESAQLRGFIDRITPQVIEGWAQNVEHPGAPVCLDILAGGRLIGQVLANRYRGDLERGGIGNGRHSFAFAPPDGLVFAPDVVEVRRSLDGSALELSAKAKLAVGARAP